MPSVNLAIIAAAGAGKTRRIVREALKSSERAALVTFTLENVEHIRREIYKEAGAIPPNVEVWPWFTFLIHELARPYQTAICTNRIDGLTLVNDRSARYVREDKDPIRFYFADGRNIYSDKLARFACVCNERTGGRVIRRLEERFDHIYIDEVQDLAGYDLDVLRLLLGAKTKLTVVGDHRQATLTTNNASRNKGYARSQIVRKLEEWKQEGLLDIDYATDTYRSNQVIATFADTLFPDQPTTTSRNELVTGHDGVFSIGFAEVTAYVEKYGPQALRLDKRTDCAGLAAMNYGVSKGRTFDRVLIFLHKGGAKWIASGDFKHIAAATTKTKMYVGFTRARHSLTFVVDGDVSVANVVPYTIGKA